MADGARPSPNPDSSGPIGLRALSSRQKREVATLAAAGLASTIFFLVPLLNVTGEEPLLVPSTIVVQMAAIAAPPLSTVPAAPVLRARTVASRLPRRALPSVVLANANVVSTPAVTPRDTEWSRKAPGRLTRVLLGDGRYRVQPFPMVSEQN